MIDKVGRKFWIAACCVLSAIILIAWFAVDRGPTSQTGKPKLAILSSIDLQWGEAGLRSIAQDQAQPDPLVDRLAQTGDVGFVDSIAQIQASKVDVALLIQPRALSPEELVRLDGWVRAGGRVLVFADPALQWPSDLPIGDPQRPLFTSLLSPLLKHCGLELALPMDDPSETVSSKAQTFDLEFVSPGTWVGINTAKGEGGRCRIDRGGFVAECRPGKGQAILIADADMLQSGLWQSAIPGTDSNENLAWVEAAIEALARGQRFVSR